MESLRNDRHAHCLHPHLRRVPNPPGPHGGAGAPVAALAPAGVAGGELLAFAGDAMTEAALRDVIATEAPCCAFLAFELRRTAGSLELAITGPDDARAPIGELFT